MNQLEINEPSLILLLLNQQIESNDGLFNTQPRMIRKTTETIHNTNSFTTASDSSTTRTTSSTKTTTHEFFSSFDRMKI